MLKKIELYKFLNKEYKEFDLRYFSLKLRENTNNQQLVFVSIISTLS